MNNEEFVKVLKKKLKYLTDEAQEEEIKKYQNTNTNNINVIEEANKIYKKRGLKITVKKNITFIESIRTVIEIIKGNNKEDKKSIISYLVYLLLLIILIKIPFIYIRDLALEIISSISQNRIYIKLCNFSIELLYAITAIATYIILLKKKTKEYNKIKNK